MNDYVNQAVCDKEARLGQCREWFAAHCLGDYQKVKYDEIQSTVVAMQTSGKSAEDIAKMLKDKYSIIADLSTAVSKAIDQKLETVDDARMKKQVNSWLHPQQKQNAEIVQELGKQGINIDKVKWDLLRQAVADEPEK